MTTEAANFERALCVAAHFRHRKDPHWNWSGAFCERCGTLRSEWDEYGPILEQTFGDDVT